MNYFTAEIVVSKTNMKEALVELSGDAFRVLNMLSYKVLKKDNLKDSNACKFLGYGKNKYANIKWELKEYGYIAIIQLSSNHFIWLVGKEAIARDKEKWQGKDIKEHIKLCKQVFEKEEIVETDFVTTINENGEKFDELPWD